MNETQRIEVGGGKGRRSGFVRLAALMALSALALGCPHAPKVEEVAAPQISVSSFSEGSPVRALSALPPYVFSVSRDGLDRWEPEVGQSLQLSAEHGLPGDRVESMTYDPVRRTLWIATDNGVTRLEVQTGSFSEIPPPPQVLGLMPLSSVVIEPAGDGGLWIGHPRGLYYTNPAGQWTETPIRVPITALHRAADGWLWIGTSQGLLALLPSGESFSYGPEQGCNIEDVQLLATAPGEVPMAVGTNQDGEQRVVLFYDKRCATYRVAPESETWVSVTRSGNELLVLTPDHLYRLFAEREKPPSLDRHGMRLWITESAEGIDAPSKPFDIRLVSNIEVPDGARVVAAGPEQILLGTSSLGTARYTSDAKVSWLRRSELVADAISLSVACRSARDCYVGTGTHGWHYVGTHFEPVSDTGGPALAFARDNEGEIFALVRGEDERHLHVEQLEGDAWTRLEDIVITTPGLRAEPVFARMSPEGSLWVGLRYREALSAVKPYGLAEIELDSARVRYHRRQRRRPRSMMPVPLELSDIAFPDSGEVWLASPQGAVQIRKRRVKVHKETSDGQGLKTEVVRGIAASPEGAVYIASREGVAAFEGTAWRYPSELAGSVNDVAVGAGGRLWMATQRGLAYFEGGELRRIDIHRGLLQNQLDDVDVDHLGRAWVYGAKGISIVAP